MTFKIIADRLSIDRRAVPFVPTPNQGGRIEPTLIVLHDTAGRLEKGSSVKWLSQKRAGVSAHFVVERDGSVTQLVDCDMKAAHAGESTWRGRRYCNGYSIGIEIVSPGSLTVRGDRAFAWFGQSWPLTDCVKGKSDLHGESYWLPYTPEQIASVEKMIRALAIAYPRITDVVGHFEVSPRRKVDVGPHYPLARARAILANRNAPEPDLVAAAQKRLTELGYWPGAIDGHAGIDTRAASSRRTEPAGFAGGQMPTRARASVDFPDPLGPIIPSASPASNLNETFLMIVSRSPGGATYSVLACPQIVRTFSTPIHAPAGRWFHVILRMPVGTATASQVIAGNVSVEGYFE